MKNLINLLIAIIGFSACSLIKKDVAQKAELTSTIDTSATDTVNKDIVFKIESNFQQERDLHWTVSNILLKAYFDIPNAKMHAHVTLSASPITAIDSITIDALGMFISDTIYTYTLNGDTFKNIKKYDGKQLVIKFDKSINRNDTIQIAFNYIAMPNELLEKELITNEDQKGMFFINNKEDKDKPVQIWTQGETVYNRSWLPMIDQPNTKITQDFYFTVDTPYVVLSNGRLVYYLINEDASKTFYWKQENKHAPYLAMVAVGKYAIVEDELDEIPFYYYVEPEYEKYAKLIFGKSPEMVQFFSNKFGVNYPWEKSAHIVVRDYTSGAMENTSAIVYMDRIQQDSFAYNDNSYEDFVVHEIAHHWFGNLVTCKSWSNLVLNEGFTSYAEFLWLEHKKGRKSANLKLLEWQRNYFFESNYLANPLVNFDYKHPDNMFNAHSYSKGALAVHQLRNYLGDEAFFLGLQYYLKSNAFSVADIYAMQAAMEKASGKQLDNYFNELFFKKGHPIVNLKYDLDKETNVLNVTATQEQSLKTFSHFSFNLSLWVTTTLEKKRITIPINQPKVSHKIKLNGDYYFVSPSVDGNPLVEFDEEKEFEFWLPQLEEKGEVAWLAANAIVKQWSLFSDEQKEIVAKKALKPTSDKYLLRQIIQQLNIDSHFVGGTVSKVQSVLKFAENDYVLITQILEFLTKYKGIKYNELKAYYQTPSYVVKQKVIELLPKLSLVDAEVDLIKWFKDNNNSILQAYLASGLLQYNSQESFNALKSLTDSKPEMAVYFFRYLSERGIKVIVSNVDYLIEFIKKHHGTNYYTFLEENINSWLAQASESINEQKALEALKKELSE